MKTYLRVCLVSMLVVMAAAASAEPITLEYKFTVGEVDKYKMTMDMSMEMPAMGSKTTAPPTNMSMTMTWAQKTLEVNPDGSAKLQVTYGEPTISGPKMPANAAKTTKLGGKSVIMTMSKRGQMLSMEGLDKVMASSGLKNLDFSKFTSGASSGPLFPEGPAEVGQSWSQEIPFPFGNSQMNVTSTLVSTDEQLWSQKAARLKQVFNGQLDLADIMKAVGPAAAGSAKGAPDLSSMTGNAGFDGHMSFVFAPELGKLLKGDGNVGIKMTMNMPAELTKQGAPPSVCMNMNMRMTITRFK